MSLKRTSNPMSNLISVAAELHVVEPLFFSQSSPFFSSSPPFYSTISYHFILYLQHLLLCYNTALILCQNDILDILIPLFLPRLLRLSSYLLPPSSSQLDFLAILIHEHVVKRGEVCPYEAACIHIYPE